MNSKAGALGSDPLLDEAPRTAVDNYQLNHANNIHADISPAILQFTGGFTYNLKAGVQIIFFVFSYIALEKVAPEGQQRRNSLVLGVR